MAPRDCRSMLLFAGLTAFLLCGRPVLAGQDAGSLEGRVTNESGAGVSGVAVVVNDTALTGISDANGRFAFARVPAGTYSVSLMLGKNLRVVPDVVVVAHTTTPLEARVDWQVGFADSLTVTGASRRIERIVEAPAAVTTVPEAEIARKASSAQLPKLLEFTPGADVTQSGVYDFNVNTRGFNSSLNRRVAVLIDGRDPTVSMSGSQEWAAIGFPLDDIATLDFIRGPSAALYGANASSGVISITTKQPRYSPGGMVRFTTGELATANLDLRWAGKLGGGWYGKVVAGSRRSRDFSVSRVTGVEYSVPCVGASRGDCLPLEAAPLEREIDTVSFGGLRLDRYLGNGAVATVEGGYAELAGPVLQTGIGRIQVVDAQRPWARVNWHQDRFNVLAYYTGRKTGHQLALGSNTNLELDEAVVGTEGQANWSFAGDTVRVVAGGSAVRRSTDSAAHETGLQTLIVAPVDAHNEAAFGQIEWQMRKSLKVVFAGRADVSTLHTFQFSPKTSVVYSFSPSHSARFTYNRAFQVPNFSEFFLQAAAAPPVNLTALNPVCAAYGVNCGFGQTPVLAVGNRALAVESVSSWEAGYTGTIGRRAYFTLDFYQSFSKNFITDLLPQLGTALGRVNPAYGPWQAPAGLPAPVADAIRAQVPLLSNASDGSNILAAASYANFGRVRSHGIDVGANYEPARSWMLSVNYSWFDFAIDDQLPGFSSLLLPNAPAHKWGAGLGYARRPLDVTANVRWVDTFRWGVGPFQGDVDAYTSVDVAANYALATHWSIGLNIANALNTRRWESFGGDVLRRRTLMSLGYNW